MLSFVYVLNTIRFFFLVVRRMCCRLLITIKDKLPKQRRHIPLVLIAIEHLKQSEVIIIDHHLSESLAIFQNGLPRPIS